MITFVAMSQPDNADALANEIDALISGADDDVRRRALRTLIAMSLPDPILVEKWCDLIEARFRRHNVSPDVRKQVLLAFQARHPAVNVKILPRRTP